MKRLTFWCFDFSKTDKRVTFRNNTPRVQPQTASKSHYRGDLWCPDRTTTSGEYRTRSTCWWKRPAKVYMQLGQTSTPICYLHLKYTYITLRAATLNYNCLDMVDIIMAHLMVCSWNSNSSAQVATIQSTLLRIGTRGYSHQLRVDPKVSWGGINTEWWTAAARRAPKQRRVYKSPLLVYSIMLSLYV